MTAKKVAIFLLLFIVAMPPLHAGTEYGPFASDWVVFDDEPAGASINFIDAPLLGKSVVQTNGAGRTNSYLVGGVNSSTGWNNQSEFLLSWRLKSAEFSHLFVRVNTTLGWRFLQYNPLTKNKLVNANGRYIHHGLGDSYSDGKWHTWTRNLAADLKAAEPDNQLLAVNGIIVRGSVAIDSVRLDAENQAPVVVVDGGDRTVEINSTIRLDSQNSVDPDGAIYSYVWRDAKGNTISESTTWETVADSVGSRQISLEITDNEDLASIVTTNINVTDSASATVYFNGDGGSLEGWRLSDIKPRGAAFENVTDPDDKDNRAIQLTSTGVKNSFLLGRINPRNSWNNTEQTTITWRSRSGNNFRIYVRVTTTEGPLFIWYDTRNQSNLANEKGSYIHYGLGNGARNGKWQTFTRDLQADLELAQPGNTITAVHAIVVRGSVMLDDIALLGGKGGNEPPVVPEINIPNAPTIILPEENFEYAADGTIVLQWLVDSAVQKYDFKSINRLTGAVINSNTFDSAVVCGDETCALSKVNDLPASDGYQLQVRAINAEGSSDWSVRNFSIAEPIIEPPPAPEAPAIILPTENAEILSDATITMQWEVDAEASTYEFMSVNSATQAVISEKQFESGEICDQRNCTVSMDNELPAGADYQLRISASNSQGSSDWSVRNVSIVDPVIVAVEPLVVPPVALPIDPPPLLPAVEPPASIPELPSGPPLPVAPDIPGEPILTQPSHNEAFEFNSNIALKWLADTKAASYDFGLYNPRTESTTYTSAISPDDICAADVCTWNHQVEVPVGDGYKLRIRAGNDVGNSNWIERSFSVVEPETVLTADFSVSTLTGPAPLAVTVDASASTDPVGIASYRWDFGGQEILQGSDLVTASHLFEEPGAYSIILTVSDATGTSDSKIIIVTVQDDEEPPGMPTEEEAARLLAQASFGATDNAIGQVRDLGIEGWIDSQFTLNSPPHLDYVLIHSNGSNRDARHEIFWQSAVNGEDQLRSRVAFALSQLLVVSDVGKTLANSQYGVTNYYDILRNNAFGNYRELLEEVTLNPVMGIFLSALQNDKANEENNTRADENYAREVLQLFSVGQKNLNQDGTLAGGNTFTQEHVEDFARVFTGWNYKNAGHWDRGLSTGQDLISPMEPFEDHHDTGSKTLLGGEIIPAGLSAQEDIERAMDNIFAHPNVAPFVSRHLIIQLVTSNPSPAYIGRVAAAFNNNGEGVRGDLKATVKAVLMDQEARNPGANANVGKLREPVLRLSHLWRAFSVTPGTQNVRGELNTYSPMLRDLDGQTGQAVLRAPSVFSFYHPDYSPNGPIADAGLVGPEFEIFTDGNILGTISRFNTQIHRFFKQTTSESDLKPSYIDYEAELQLASDPQALLDRMNLLLMSGSMSAELNNLLLTHLESLPADEKGNTQRVQDALSLIIASPEYLVQQ